ncbi:MAG TPA: LrgB family protein [Clostridiaceae bacterium]|nr:LrgB family protein [Clostridiaceae bacterium]
MERFMTLTASPLFGLMITLLAYQAGVLVHKKLKTPLLGPLVVASGLIILLLVLTGIPVENYSVGGSIITFFLGPSVVVLALPLYRNFRLLKANWIAILSGITVGSFAGILTILVLSFVLDLDGSIMISILPKSVTTPIGLEITKELGGISSITVLSIFTTGLLGAMIYPYVFKVFRIKHPVAKGVALGTAAHALGTAKAVEIGDQEGAMSGLSIGLAGIVTVFLIPLVLSFLGIS